MKLNPLTLAVSLALGLSNSAVYAVEQLPTSIVTADISAVDKIDGADNARVSEAEGGQVISSGYIKAQQATTLADAMRKTSSVQIDEEGGQQGNLIFIRGFTQDQVSIRVEGAPKNFNQVRHGGAGTVWLEPQMYKSIYVIPGVASNVYGSGSLGGVILMETKDPEDIIREGKTWGASVTTGFETNASSTFIATDVAKQLSDKLAISGTAVVRDTEQYKDGKGDKALLGSTGTEDLNLLIKGVYKPAPDHRIEASYTGLRKEYEARTTVGSGAYGAPSQIEVDDNTYSLQYGLNPQDNQYVDLKARVSRAETERWRLSEPTQSTPDPVPAIWNVETTYFELENVSTFFPTDTITNKVRYGLDYTVDDVQTAYSNKDKSPMLAERSQFGVYASNTATIGEDIEVMGSIRYDDFKNTVDNTPSTSETAFSPKIAATYRPFTGTVAEGLGFYGLLGKGFRAPSVHEARADAEVNCGRRGCSQRLPNSALKGESSDSWELGFRYDRSGLFSSGDQLNIKVGYINNDAEDYISSEKVGETKTTVMVKGIPTEKDVDILQYQNIDKAEINGVEASINYTSDKWFTSLTAQNIDGNYASGPDSGSKLPEISPASLNFTLGSYLFEGKSRVGVDVSHRQKRKFSQRGSDRLRESFTIYDVFGSYQWNDNLSMQLRIENILDEHYSKRKIVKIDGEDTTTYAPGRNAKLSLSYRF